MEREGIVVREPKTSGRGGVLADVDARAVQGRSMHAATVQLSESREFSGVTSTSADYGWKTSDGPVVRHDGPGRGREGMGADAEGGAGRQCREREGDWARRPV